MQRLAFIAGLLICCGCGPLTVQPDKTDDVKPVVAVETRWTLIAESIDESSTLPKNSTQLSLMLTHLRSLGRITDAEVAACKACVPKIDELESALTKEHSDAIRRLK